MKTHPWTYCAATGLLGWLLLLGGCSSEPSSAPPLTKVVVTNPPAPTTPPPAPAPAPAVANATTPVAPTNAPVAAAPTATLPPQRIALPPAVDAVADLAQSQVGELVILEYVKKSTNAFDLTADQIIYFKDIGLSEQVIAAMMARTQELRAAGAVPSPGSPTSTAAAPVPTAPVPTEPAPAAPEYASPPPAPASATLAQPDTAVAAAAVYQQPVTQVNNNYFYTALSPYGSWVEMPGYGWCWRPTVAVVDTTWQPYAQGGRWVYTDSGWYWQSSYSWGWAAFHYGNWYRSPACGWVWVPGYTWAPAWVTWRYTDDYCGWAPLPPGCGWNTGIGLTYYGAGVSVGFSFGLGYDCFTFVSYRNFCDPHPYRHCLPRHEMRRVYDHSVVHNEYDHRNHSVVNRGIAPSRITAVTRGEIRKVELRDVTREPNAPQRADRLEREGRELAVYRPQPGSNPASRPAPVSRHSVEPASASPRNMADTVSRTGAPMPTREVRPTNPNLPATAAPASRSRAEAPPTRNNAPVTIQSPNRTAGNPAPQGTVNAPSNRSRGEIGATPAPTAQPARTEVNRTTRATPSPAAPAASVPTPGVSRTAPPVSRSEPANRTATASRAAPRESIRNEPMKVEAPASVNVAPPKYANGVSGGGGYSGGGVANPAARPMTRDPGNGYSAPVGAPRNAPAAGPAPGPNRPTGPSGPAYAPAQRGPAPAPSPQPAQSAPAGGNNGGNNGGRGNNRVQPN